MKRFSVLAVLAVLFVACAPGARTVPGAEPIFYSADKEQVYASVVEIISTSPGLDNSSGWIITQSDSAGGFIRAQTTLDNNTSESVSVVVSQAGNGRAQVIVQLSSGADALAKRIVEQLDLRFNRSS